jgi:mRNA interferase MazF
MQRMFSTLIVTALVGLGCVNAAWAGDDDNNHTTIVNATVSQDQLTLSVTGTGFGKNPFVALNNMLLGGVVVNATGTGLVATMPHLEPGSYQLLVLGKKHKQDDDSDRVGVFVLTVGAVGPKGEKGDKGDKGDQGVQGNDGTPGTNGTNGKDGKDGKDGASPFTLIGNNAVYQQGNVGVGTPAPSALIQAGPGQNFGNITTLGVSQRPTDTVALSLRNSFANTVFQFCGAGAAGNCNYIEQDTNTNNLHLGTNGFGGFPSMTVQRQGNIGVGTLTPSALTQVGPGQNFGNITTLGVSQRPQDTVGASVRSDFQNPTFQFCANPGGACSYVQMDKASTNLWFGDFQNPSMVVQGKGLGGFVGIGTLTPGRILHLRHADNNGVMMDRMNPNVFSGFQVHENGALNERWFIGMPAGASSLVLRNRAANNVFTLEDNAPANALYLQATGDVGVGTTGPNALLHVGDGQNFGNITTLGVSQRQTDTVALSLRNSFANTVFQFCGASVAAGSDRRAGMARRLNRGEIWLLALSRPDKRRPVLVLSRPSLIGLLHTVTVAAVTSTLRGSPTEVEVGPDEGLKTESCVNLCNVYTVRQSDLRTFVGTLGPAKMRAVCAALAVASGCD